MSSLSNNLHTKLEMPCKSLKRTASNGSVKVKIEAEDTKSLVPPAPVKRVKTDHSPVKTERATIKAERATIKAEDPPTRDLRLFFRRNANSGHWTAWSSTRPLVKRESPPPPPPPPQLWLRFRRLANGNWTVSNSTAPTTSQPSRASEPADDTGSTGITLHFKHHPDGKWTAFGRVPTKTERED